MVEFWLMGIFQIIVVNYRLYFILAFNILLTLASLTVALGLRFDFNYTSISNTHIIIPFLILLLYRQSSYLYFSLNEGYWRYTSMNDLSKIIKAHLVSSVFFAASIWGFQLSFPRSVIVGEFILSIVLCGGSRFLTRWLSEYLVDRANLKSGMKLKESVILGAGNSGHLLVKLLQNSTHIPYLPTIILDDLERLKGTSVYGIKVSGTIGELEKVLKNNQRINAVFIAIPSLSDARLQEIKEVCAKYNVAFKKLQSFEDIACLDASSALQTASIESLLDREINVEHEDQISSALTGKRILVTGAGGSIGSELVRQILTFNPEKLILLDNSEYNLFKMSQELLGNHTNIELVVADICDITRIHNILSMTKPEYVFHAAAYKHVPLMEDNSYEAFKNNVIGTKRLHDLSAMHGVAKFVSISTDKAVDPCSIMGCSKKLAELFIQYQSRNTPKVAQAMMQSAIVRFGNVINSAGSVIPVFKEQIAKGGPITVTHPEMDRFFMSIREAVRLVLTAGTFKESGEIYVLDMGQKIKIVDLANKMLKLYGRRDIQIVFTGLRPGEKMTEYLLAPYETLTPTTLKKVGRLNSKIVVSSEVITWLNQMELDLANMSNAQISEAMKNFIAKIEAQAGSDNKSENVVNL